MQRIDISGEILVAEKKICEYMNLKAGKMVDEIWSMDKQDEESRNYE